MDSLQTKRSAHASSIVSLLSERSNSPTRVFLLEDCRQCAVRSAQCAVRNCIPRLIMVIRGRMHARINTASKSKNATRLKL